jgi:hypothetical protein
MSGDVAYCPCDSHVQPAFADRGLKIVNAKQRQQSAKNFDKQNFEKVIYGSPTNPILTFITLIKC